MTTKKYVEKAVALAERLQEEGIKKGDYIALVGNNSLNMNIALGGIFFFGAIPFPISHRTTAGNDSAEIFSFFIFYWITIVQND